MLIKVCAMQSAENQSISKDSTEKVLLVVNFKERIGQQERDVLETAGRWKKEVKPFQWKDMARHILM